MLAWFWHWFVVPVLVLFFILPVYIGFSIPKFGSIVNIVAIAWVAISGVAIIGIERFNIPELHMVVYVLLALAVIDCVIEFIIEMRLKEGDDPVKSWKVGIISGVFYVVALVFHFNVAFEDRGLSNITGNYTLILAISLLPRAISTFLEIRGFLVERVKAIKLLSTNNFFEAPNIYQERYAGLEVAKGNAVSNSKVRSSENKTSENKLKAKHPKLEGEKLQEKMEQMMNEQKYKTSVSYVSKVGYDEFCIMAEETLRTSGTFSPRTFVAKKFPQEKEWLSLGIEFFVIMAFAAGVENGRITDENLDDSSIFVNHTYRHNECEKKMVSRELVL